MIYLPKNQRNFLKDFYPSKEVESKKLFLNVYVFENYLISCFFVVLTFS